MFSTQQPKYNLVPYNPDSKINRQNRNTNRNKNNKYVQQLNYQRYDNNYKNNNQNINQNNNVNINIYPKYVYPNYTYYPIQYQKYIFFIADVSKLKGIKCIIHISGLVKNITLEYIEMKRGQKYFYNSLQSGIHNYFTQELMDLNYLKSLC